MSTRSWISGWSWRSCSNSEIIFAVFCSLNIAKLLVSVCQFIFAALGCEYEYCHIEGRERHRALHAIEWRLIKGPPAEDGQEAVQSDPRGNQDGEQDGESRAARSGREALDRPLKWTGASNVFSSQPHDRLDRVLDMGRRWRRDFFRGTFRQTGSH
jgi:hypothetical protein